VTAISKSSTTIDDLRRQLDESPGAWYAVVDACGEASVPPRMEELGERAVSLYRGTAEEELSAIAPYLAVLDRKLLRWILNEFAAKPWGFFAETSVDLTDLRRHFRHFLTVEDPDGELVYFRFYDPRVLPVFLESCTREEATTFFGPVRRFVVSDADGAWHECRLAALGSGSAVGARR